MRNGDLNKLSINKKTGKESFHQNGKSLNTNLLEFWQWSASDLISNTARGILAEYIVACDLGVANGVRMEWDAYELQTENGIKVEVKSAAYLQSWHQNKLSAISFGIASSFAWDAEINKFVTEKKRQADIYVFCLLKHKDKKTVDPLNVNQWEFSLLPTIILNQKAKNQKRISFNKLLSLKPTKITFGEIEKTIESLL